MASTSILRNEQTSYLDMDGDWEERIYAEARRGF